MKFNDGAEVYAADGKRLGDLERVVLNPHTWEVTDIIVHKGFFFSTDKVIPVQDIQQTLEDRVTLVGSAGDETYPDYVEREYIPLNAAEQASVAQPAPLLWYPPVGSMTFAPAGVSDPYLVHKKLNIPEGTQALEINARVISAEGEHMGHVEEVFMESSTNQASHFLVSKGPMPSAKLVPIYWIKNIDGDQIYLEVGSRVLMSLPDYNQKP